MPSIVKSALALICLISVAIPGQPVWSAQVDVADVVFEEVEKRLIREYFGTRDSGSDQSDAQKGKRGKGPKWKKGKGRGKGNSGKRGNRSAKHKWGKQGLPPGLAKRERLPPGLDKRKLPRDLERTLPPAQKGTERVIIDNDVVLVQKATGVVLDILMDAIKNAK